jgi:hypothetical protein
LVHAPLLQAHIYKEAPVHCLLPAFGVADWIMRRNYQEVISRRQCTSYGLKESRQFPADRNSSCYVRVSCNGKPSAEMTQSSGHLRKLVDIRTALRGRQNALRHLPPMPETNTLDSRGRLDVRGTYLMEANQACRGAKTIRRGVIQAEIGRSPIKRTLRTFSGQERECCN